MSSTAGHWRTFLDSDVIRYVDMQDKEFAVQIKTVKKGKVTGSGGKSSTKAMIWFEGGEKPLGCGTAILTQIAALHGNDTRKWPGKWITIWPDPNVSFGGAKVGGVRVRPTVPTAGKSAATQRPVAANDTTEPDGDTAEAAEIEQKEASNA